MFIIEPTEGEPATGGIVEHTLNVPPPKVFTAKPLPKQSKYVYLPPGGSILISHFW